MKKEDVWDMATIPLDAWLREKDWTGTWGDDNRIFRILAVDPLFTYYGLSATSKYVELAIHVRQYSGSDLTLITASSLARSYEWSMTPQDKASWKPCTRSAVQQHNSKINEGK